MLTQRIAEFVWVAGIVAWYVIRHRFQRRAKKIEVAKSLYDWWDFCVLALATLGNFVIPAVYIFTGFPALFDRPFVPMLAWLGAVVLCAALWLFRRSHVDLGRNWSISLELRKQHTLVKTGAYRFIRHPMYSSFFLLGLAQMLLLPNWLAGASGLLGNAILYASRVRQEERMMLECFGNDYRGFMAQTKRLIPWII